MPGIPTLKPETTSLSTLRKHWIFLLVGVQSDPRTATLAPSLQALGPQFDTTAKQAQTLSDAVLAARAHAVAVDNVLNHLADQVSAAIHDGKKPDLDLPLHHLYFGTAKPSDLKRPILGTQLDTMRAWPDLLAKADQPALHALAPAVTLGIAAATAAETKLTQAFATEDKFQLDGERKQLFDAYNSLAATTYGKLKAIALDQPALKLPPDWADGFFIHEPHPQGAATVAAAESEVKRLETALEAAKKRLVDLQSKQEQAEVQKAAEAEAQTAVEAAQKEAIVARQRAKDAIAAAKKVKSLRA